MDLELSSKHVLITGGSKGIGLACAAAFLAEGARVTLVSRSEAHLQAAQASLRAANKNAIVNIIAADLRDAAAAEQMVDVVERDFGVVDVLVNSAGAAKRTPAAELTAAAWHDAMQAKFFTYIHVTNPLIKRMGDRGSGAVVNVDYTSGIRINHAHLTSGDHYGSNGMFHAVDELLSLPERPSAAKADPSSRKKGPRKVSPTS